jgi:hypothetical protein
MLAMRGSQPASDGHSPRCLAHIQSMPAHSCPRQEHQCVPGTRQAVTCWSMEAAAQFGACRWPMALHKLAAISCISHDWSRQSNRCTGLRSSKFLCCAWQQVLLQGSSRSLAACKTFLGPGCVLLKHGRQGSSQTGCV